jgi:hypothetical protein
LLASQEKTGRFTLIPFTASFGVFRKPEKRLDTRRDW